METFVILLVKCKWRGRRQWIYPTNVSVSISSGEASEQESDLLAYLFD